MVTSKLLLRTDVHVGSYFEDRSTKRRMNVGELTVRNGMTVG